MKAELRVLMAILVAAGLSASCGSTKSTKKEGKKLRQTAKSLNGEWDASCQKQDWFNFTQAAERFRFSPLGDFEKRTEIFRKDCKAADLVIETGGTYDSLGKAKDIPDAKEINFTISAASVTPKSEDAVKALKAMKYCSISEWALGKKEDVLGKDCAGVNYKNGEVVYDIYRQKNKQLYFGKKMLFLAGETANDRPVKLEEKRVFVKK